ncbi:hypothetical protein ICM05_09800 [Leucobacter sp. cx-42]|uniref:hypothetical protein n=1 Tax=unclassified Leucobacter TaxID=2621730 RepID=UPI00165DB1DB|nr:MULTISPECIES: hypothetical protein [unclassified Leucobacter]MBC9954930.1 hypothetical protein [Leucobacter sp. cx-42]
MQTPFVKIVVTAQVGDSEPIEIATADAPITVDANGNATITLGKTLGDGATESAPCLNHKPVQHRDFKPPWCEACGEFGGGGGWLVENKTGRPERILSDEQWEQMTADKE